MNYIIGFFKVLKYIFMLLLSVTILGVFFIRLLEWGLAYAIVQPKAEDIAYELTTYAEANEVRLTDDVLKSFMDSWKEDGYIHDHEEVRIRYIQYAGDKRFKVHVTVHAQFWNQPIWADGWSELQGINWDQHPVNTVAGHYPSYEDEDDNETEAVAAAQEEVVETEKADLGNAETADSVEQIEEKPPAEKISDESIRSFMEHYVTAGLAAIDYNDFSMVEDLLDPDGKAYKESKNYIKHMNDIGMEQELLEMEVTRISPINEDGFNVSTTEEYRITDHEHTVKIKRYESEYYLVLMNDGKLAMRELVKTDLLSSAEVDSVDNDELGTDFYEQMGEGVVLDDPYEVYVGACASCHGVDFEGGAGQSLIGIGSYMDQNQVKDIILYGHGSMQAGLLDDNQAEALAAYLVELE